VVLTEEGRVEVAEAAVVVDLIEELVLCIVPEDVAAGDVGLLDDVLERSLASCASISCTRC